MTIVGVGQALFWLLIRDLVDFSKGLFVAGKIHGMWHSFYVHFGRYLIAFSCYGIV